MTLIVAAALVALSWLASHRREHYGSALDPWCYGRRTHDPALYERAALAVGTTAVVEGLWHLLHDPPRVLFVAGGAAVCASWIAVLLRISALSGRAERARSLEAVCALVDAPEPAGVSTYLVVDGHVGRVRTGNLAGEHQFDRLDAGADLVERSEVRKIVLDGPVRVGATAEVYVDGSWHQVGPMVPGGLDLLERLEAGPTARR